MADSILVHLVGDVGPRRIEYGEDPKTLFAASRGRLREADIRFCQLERTLSKRGSPQLSRPGAWFGQVDPGNLAALLDAGFDVVSVASNHAGDNGIEPFLETLDLLKKNGIAPVGGGANLAEASAPVILERKGTKVAFLAYCSILPQGLAAGPKRSGVAPVEIATSYQPLTRSSYTPGVPPKVITTPKAEHVAAMVRGIQEARKAADVVIVSFHYGIPWVTGNIADYQTEISHAAIDGGADLVFGHHPHIIKAIEVYNGKVIFYSAGDFAQETPHQERKNDDVTGTSFFNVKELQDRGSKPSQDPAWARFMGPVERRYSMIARCRITGGTIERVSFLPVYINPRAEPEPLRHNDPRFDEVFSFAAKYANEVGTKLSVVGDEVVVDV
jgi:poly-gamma-glutamate capsule biosynthesis protein CapA/YwtB (metallophosphatase superfamily)